MKKGCALTKAARSRLSEVVLLMKVVLKREQQMEPAKHLYNVLEGFKGIEIFTVILLESANADHGELIAHPDDDILLGKFALHVGGRDAKLLHNLCDDFLISLDRGFFDVQSVK